MDEDFEKWKNKNSYPRKYKHFDNPRKLDDVLDYLLKSENIAQHSFYPFLHFVKEQSKFKEGQKKSKKRKLYYCSHLDRYVYSYYAFKLNQCYNAWADKEGLNESTVAYRTNLKKSTIHFANSVFNKILKMEDANIFVGDFSDYFDNLDHRYLKNRLKSLLGVDELHNDYYAVFKNITCYSWVNLNELMNVFLGNDRFEKIRPYCKHKFKTATENLQRLFTAEEFRVKVKPIIYKNRDFGIPQGSPISAVLSNIYLMDFDVQIKNFVTHIGGFYLRYCDDFIVVVPGSYPVKDLVGFIQSQVKNIPRLILKDEKQQTLCFSKSQIKNGGQNTSLNFLGFSFDGQFVRLREKTIYRFYRRLYHKIATIKKQRSLGRKGGGTKNLYQQFSIKGAYPPQSDKNVKLRGNFFTYLHQVKKIMGKKFCETIERKHFRKIRRSLREI